MFSNLRLAMASTRFGRKSEKGSTQGVRSDYLEDAEIARSIAAVTVAEANDLERALELSKVDSHSKACVPCDPTPIGIICATGCGRESRNGYSTCCRMCAKTGGKRHFAFCEYEKDLADAILASAKEASAKEAILREDEDHALGSSISSQSTAASDDSSDASSTSQGDDEQWEGLAMCDDEEVFKRRHQMWQQHLATTRVGDVEQLQAGVAEVAGRQIDLDVPRTSGLDDAQRTSLRRVLRAFAAQNPTTGYCQGMNSLAAVFITSGFDESTALQGLCSLIERCCPEYFGPSLEGYVRDTAILDVLVRKVLSPAVYRSLSSLDMPLNLLAADHFLTLGSHTWSREAMLPFWDLFISEGSPAVFASFLVLLELYLPEDGDGLEQVDIFRRAASEGISTELDVILEKTRELLPSIPQGKLEYLRNFYAEHGAHCLNVWC